MTNCVQAVDGQSLNDAVNQGAAASFYAVYGNSAPSAWTNEHNRAIGFNGDCGTLYDTNGGTKTITQIGVELRNAGYPGPWDESSMVAAYGRASGVVPRQHTAAPTPQPVSVQPSNPTSPTPVTPTSSHGTLVAAPGAQTGANIASGLGNLGNTISSPITAFGLRLPMYAWLGMAAGAYALLGGRRRR